MRKTLAESQMDPTALQAVSSYYSDFVDQVQKAIQENHVVVVGMGQNPFCKKARKALEEKNIAFKYIEKGNYFGDWKPRLALKLWSGWPTFPQVFVGGKLIGGYTELAQRLEKGPLN